MIQGGADAQHPVSYRSLFAKKPLNVNLMCGRWPLKIRYPTILHRQYTRYRVAQMHSMPDFAGLFLTLQVSFWRCRSVYDVAGLFMTLQVSLCTTRFHRQYTWCRVAKMHSIPGRAASGGAFAPKPAARHRGRTTGPTHLSEPCLPPFFEIGRVFFFEIGLQCPTSMSDLKMRRRPISKKVVKIKWKRAR